MSSSSSSLQLASVACGDGASVAGAVRRGPQLRRYLSPFILVLAWQAASMAGLLATRTLASPAQILVTGWGLLASRQPPWHLLVSLGRATAGLAIGLTLGAGLALVPLFILWFGIGETPKIALAALGTAFPIYLNLFAGIRGVEPRLAEMERVFGLNPCGMISHLINDARDFLRTDVTLVGLVPHALPGLGADMLAQALERRALAWRPLLVQA